MFYTSSKTNECSLGWAMELQDRQLQILRFIEDSLRQNGYPPTVREIAAAVGLCSPASVHGHLAALEAKGYIRRGAAKRRALELVNPIGPRNGRSGRTRALPLVGRVAAGTPILAQENIEDTLEVPAFLGGEDCFALRVTGDSMVKAGILDGDIVVVRRQETADDGDIVVALIEEEATLKRFFREEGRIRLQPENDDMEPIYVRDPVIAGKVTGVLRRL